MFIDISLENLPPTLEGSHNFLPRNIINMRPIEGRLFITLKYYKHLTPSGSVLIEKVFFEIKRKLKAFHVYRYQSRKFTSDPGGVA